MVDEQALKEFENKFDENILCCGICFNSREEVYKLAGDVIVDFIGCPYCIFIGCLTCWRIHSNLRPHKPCPTCRRNLQSQNEQTMIDLGR